MTQALELLWAPALAILVLVGIHAYFGIHVLTRGIVFVDLALAQIAAFGATVAFMLGHLPRTPASYGYALIFTALGAALLASLRNTTRALSQEAIIGVIYVVAAAAMILLIDQAPQGAEHLKSMLAGSILFVTARDAAQLATIYGAIALCHWLWWKTLLGAGSKREANSSWLTEFLFYLSFGVVVTSSVAVAGVLLVFALLIIPAAIGTLFTDRFAGKIAIGWSVGATVGFLGLALSYAFDIPTGATLVCSFGGALVLSGLARAWRGARRRPRLVVVGRIAHVAAVVLGVALALSGLWLIAAPRADQPLIDLVESLAPRLRLTTMSDYEAQVYRNATRDAVFYQSEVARLNAFEAQSRSRGGLLEDEEVRRLSSYVQSYTEMQKGEEFVRRETLGRARARHRAWLGGVMILLGLACIVPLPLLGRLRRRITRNLRSFVGWAPPTRST